MDAKYFEAKRKHHHVWADYLKRWSADGINVYHSTPTRKIKLDSVRGLAMDLDFYRVTHLAEYDVKVILQWSSRAAEDLQYAHRSYLNDFLRFQRASEIYKGSRRKIEVIEKSIKALKSNLMENLHSAHERDASPILKDLAGGKLSCLYESGSIIKFTTFLGHQFARTKNFKDRTFHAFREDTVESVEFLRSMKNSWWFLSYMFGMNLGRELYLFRSGYTHSLLFNNTGVSFITSDQPAINVHPQVWETSSQPEFLDLYYPISPRYAYIICESNIFIGGVTEVTVEQVVQLNQKMAARSSSLIVGSDYESIEEFISLVGQNR
ncbi:DUF4238 domain-containing protein [Pseudomonas sp. MH2]|uniref:DUF4238 domain-containing protein n=1 Tax=Pseudomonas machongensis TaxID=3110229 RepID=A0ABU5VFB4_9PSED|nr:DUF4238 domain-containing protein [Pseudomonas sp. MH2]MEA5672063.1 DUF4238 domain-containing protein [Pseudomonas sp. MH2]